LKKPNILKSTFSSYTVNRQIGQGGNGYVYEIEENGIKYAAKILDTARATSEKLKRFKNEFKFCSTERHTRIIKVLDHGITDNGDPFFVMPLYTGSLRDILGKIDGEQIYNLVKQLLDGVEAAHKFKVVHRDLKPENILYTESDMGIVITDFGIAEFGEEDLFTAVETKDGTRLANFQYAAPEQRIRGGIVNNTTDIYSLGLIINELFTGELPLGKNHRTIQQAYENYSFLDDILDKMLQQQQSDRFQDIEAIKLQISVRSRENLSSQKLSRLNNIVIPTAEVDDPIVSDPIRILGVEWDKGVLSIRLSHAPTSEWKWAILNMGNFTSVFGKGPEKFQFQGDQAKIFAEENDAQRIIDYFKQWLPIVHQVYERKLIEIAKKEEMDKKREIESKIAEEERKKKINASLKF
jgi:serine/threonine protein kinase